MTHEVGYDKGCMQAEKDYFDRTEKDRQASYDAGYEIGKAEAKAEHDKECDRCLYSLRKETIEEAREKAREKTIDDCKNIVKKFIGYLDEDMIGRRWICIFCGRGRQYKSCWARKRQNGNYARLKER